MEKCSKCGRPTEFDQDELSPVEVVEMTRDDFRLTPIEQLKEILGNRTVIFLEHRPGRNRHANREVFAMVIPPSIAALLEIREALTDDRVFMLAPVRLEGL